jgi:hypothetical protein
MEHDDGRMRSVSGGRTMKFFDRLALGEELALDPSGVNG